MKNQIVILALFSLLFVQLVAGSQSETVSWSSRERLLTGAPKDADAAPDYPSSSNVNTSSTNLDSDLLDIMWCGGDETKNILVLTSKGSVYSTEDHGYTWNKLRGTFQKTGKQEVDGDENVLLLYFIYLIILLGRLEMLLRCFRVL